MKIVAHTVSPFYALFLRGFLLLCINSVVVRLNHIKVDQNNKEVHVLLMKRSVFSTSALTTFMSTVAYIPIGIANSLFNTGPIIIYFLEAFYYRKQINKVHLMLTFICFVGVLFIIKPAFLFGSIESWPLYLLVLPVVGALCNSFSMLYLHELKGRVSNLIALQYFYVAQTFLTGFLQNFQTIRISK